MQIGKLDHVNVRTTKLPEMAAWYSTVLGLTDGPRPNFPFPGAWLYAGDTAVVHLVAHEGPPSAGSEIDLKLEHFAFTAAGRATFETRLQKAGIEYSTNTLDAIGIVQFNVNDPDGNHIHIDFDVNDTA